MSALTNIIKEILAIDPMAQEMEFEQHWWTWADIAEAVEAVDSALKDAGLMAGTRVGVLLRNRAECVPVILSLILSARCIVTLNALAPEQKLAEEIISLELPVIVGLSEDLARPALTQAIESAGIAHLALSPRFAEAVRLEGIAQTVSENKRHRAPGIAIEMLSSGTTGEPKRIPLKATTFERTLLGAAAFEKGRKAGEPPKLRNGVQIVSAPFSHIAGITGVKDNAPIAYAFLLKEYFQLR